MKLSMRFIASQLPYKVEVIKENVGFKYSGVGLYSPAVEVKEDVLYVCLSGEMPESCAGVVQVGKTSVKDEMPSLCVLEEVDPIKIFDDIFSVFQKFQRWSEEVTAAISRRKTLEEVMKLLDQVISNPWYLTDNCFRTCVMKEDALVMDMSAFWRYQYYHGHMAFETIYKLISSGDMARMNQAEEAIVFQKTEAFNNPFVSRTIISSKGIIGHFFIIGMYHDLTCYDLEIADYICEQITILLDYDADSTIAARGFYDFFFIDLIEGNEVKATETAILLETLKWEREDEYVACAMVSLSFRQMQEKMNTITIYEIEEIMPCKAFLYDDQLVFFVNKTRMKSRSLEEALKRAARKCNGCIGYSDVFQGFDHLAIYYRQASLTAEYAIKAQKTRVVLSYQRVCMPYILQNMLKEVSAEFITHPAVKVLERYDQENHTEFLKTLYCYLKNERRTQETVKELFIHRNSLLYRLERIQEITEFRMEDYQERMRMLISCEIYYRER